MLVGGHLSFFMDKTGQHSRRVMDVISHFSY